MPKVSVCIDVYNYADFLPQAIESALRQTLDDVEIIVVDDCSSDGSFDIAQAYAARDPRVRASRNIANLGMIGNRNACLRAATGDYVKFVHADDFLVSADALTRMVEPLDRNPAVALVASSLQLVDSRGGPAGTQRWFRSDRTIAGVSVILRSLLEQRNIVGPPTATMFRRGLSGRGFDESFFHAADWEMWCHLLEQGCFASLREPLVAYRRHARQQTEKDRATLSQWDDQRGILARYLDRPYVRFHPPVKRFLRHEVLSGAVQRSRRLGRPAEARRAIASYGRVRYRLDAARFYLWKKRRLPERLKAHYLPPDRQGTRNAPTFPTGVNVSGFLRGEYGIGDASRAYARSVQLAGVPCSLLNLEARDHRNTDRTVTGISTAHPYAINLMTFSFDYARRHALDRGPAFFEGRRNVAVWFWELEHFPARFHPNFDYYDEIWTPTAYCRRAFEAVSPIPIRQVPYPLPAVDAAGPDRARFGLPVDTFVFLFTFDFWSVVERKNPHGLLRAFRRAFTRSEPVVLLVKSINGTAHPEARRRLADEAADLNVVFIDDHLDAAGMSSLFATADCYVSLHRAEGLGLGLARSMARGTPTIATNYSGNLEFMTAENSLLVNHVMTDIGSPCGPYGPEGQWADPDLEHAAERMRWIVANRDEAAAIGARGRTDVRRALDPQRSAAVVRERVTALMRRS